MTRQISLTGKYLPEYATTKSIVGMILSENVEARSDDNELIKEVISYCMSENMRVPPSETITRARRIIQNDEGRFKADASTQKVRAERQRFFKSSAERGLL